MMFAGNFSEKGLQLKSQNTSSTPMESALCRLQLMWKQILHKVKGFATSIHILKLN
jgi:hypothetical protein